MRQHFGGTTKSLRPSERHGILGRSEQTSPHPDGSKKNGARLDAWFRLLHTQEEPRLCGGVLCRRDQSRFGRDQIS